MASSADELLDEILGEDVDEVEREEDKKKDEAPNNEHEPVVEDHEPPVEDEGEAGGDSEREDEGQDSEREETPPADEEDESESESEEDIAAKAAKDREEGLLRDLQVMRRKNQELQAQINGPQAPPATETTQVQQQQQPTNTHVPVQVSEDGSQVYLDLADPRVQEYVREQAVAANQPTPQDLRMQAIEQTDREYSMAEEGNAAIVQRAKQADDFLTEHARSLMMQGYRFNSVGELVTTMQSLGVDKQVETYFPEIGPMFPEFVESMASGNPTWRRSMYQRMRQASVPPAPPRDVPNIPQTQATEQRPNLGRTPRSMARKGGARSEGQTSDEREFQALDTQFKDDFMLMPEDKWQRMQELGRKLGKPGYED